MTIINDIVIDRFIERAFKQMKACDRLLDLGCGTQPYRKHYRSVAHEMVAADYDARSAIDVRLSADALPFPDATFDGILFSEVLEHLEYAEVAIGEIARVLRPGGQLILTVPFNFSQHEIPNDHVRYTQFGLLALLRRHGLDVMWCYQRGSLLTLCAAIGEQFVRLLGTSLQRLPRIGPWFSPVNRLCSRGWLSLAERLWGNLPARNWIARSSAEEGMSSCARLHGPRGHLRLWTLGYCVVAVKVQ